MVAGIDRTRNTMVGQSPPRKEDRRLTTGAARFIADIDLPNMMHAVFARSTLSHARILEIDTTAACAYPGVLGVFTGDQIGRMARPIRTPYGGIVYYESDWPAIAIKKVRFAGEPVAVVVATDRYIGEDAADLVHVTYERLDPVVTLDDAMRPDAPAVHNELPGNLFIDERREFGDVERRTTDASVVVEATFNTQRSAPAPLECKGALANFDRSDGRLTLWTSTQVPHVVRYGLAKCLELREDQVRVMVPDVGGGFGNKASLDPEQVVVAALSRHLARPIRWIEDRHENFLTSASAHEQRIWMRLHADTDGRILAIEAEVIANGGAYSIFPDTPACELFTCAKNLVGTYRVEDFRYRAVAVATTTCPNSPYRGMGRPSASFARERIIDMLARRIGKDPIEVRRLNVFASDELPRFTVTNTRLDSGDLPNALDIARKKIDYEHFRAEQTELRKQGRLVGLGFSCFIDSTGSGQEGRLLGKQYMIAGFDGATVRVAPNGRVTVSLPVGPSGQGHETSMAQIAADELGVTIDDIDVVHGDTDNVPYGMGSTGSRGAVAAGGSLMLAARKVREKMFTLASHLLDIPEELLELGDGSVRSTVDDEQSVSFARLAWVAWRRDGTVPPDFEPGLEAIAYWDPPSKGVASNSVHAAIVEIDQRTGAVIVQRYIVVEDNGRLIHPVIVEGQIRGAVAQGIGKALYEDVVIDADGQILNASLMDYLLPTSIETPAIEIVHTETPSPVTLGGFKGAGESGLIGTTAAIGNAIVDALGGRVDVFDLPFTPENVWLLLQNAGVDATNLNA